MYNNKKFVNGYHSAVHRFRLGLSDSIVTIFIYSNFYDHLNYNIGYSFNFSCTDDILNVIQKRITVET